MVLCCSGGLTAKRVMELAGQRFSGSAPDSPLPKRRPLNAAQDRPRLLMRTPRWPTVSLRLAHRAFPWHDPRTPALHVCNEILGAGTSSRLFVRVREELGLVYDIGSDLALFSDGGSLDVTGSAERDTVVKTLEAVMAELDRMRDGDVDDALVDETIERLRCRLDFLTDSAYETAEWYAKQSLLLGPDQVRSPEAAIAAVQAVRADDVIAVARDLFVPERRVLVAVGPLTAAQRRRVARTVGVADAAGVQPT
jgi:predicted Zn-dependent peptidase